MKPVFQKIVDDKEGDCLGACIASLLHWDKYPNPHNGLWLDEWNDYLGKINLQIIEYPLGSFPPPRGYSILVVKSAVFENVRHAVVFEGDGYYGKVVHNPNPKDPRGLAIPNEDWLAFKVLALLVPSEHHHSFNSNLLYDLVAFRNVAHIMADAIRAWCVAKDERKDWVPSVGAFPPPSFADNARRANSLLMSALADYEDLRKDAG